MLKLNWVVILISASCHVHWLATTHHPHYTWLLLLELVLTWVLLKSATKSAWLWSLLAEAAWIRSLCEK